MRRRPAVYILSSRRNGTLYVGVTSDLVGRISLHKQNLFHGFSERYSVHHVVYYEFHETMVSAIRREKSVKRWRRDWKIELIEKTNPYWRDLYPELSGLIDPNANGGAQWPKPATSITRPRSPTMSA
ncbi:MAG: GIY-YIG nuclease family protein [Hyphomicrobiaceae bacterium]|nr:GIY-YIG nuclease family protein [Hyphomicrobiaceae bacterium]